ncbi:MAG: bifunctional histidinol-phosphatase/imidazoleglycerol-phosphate dehydratase HisB [Gammaproteobacteria bacterium]|nr:bifunctional histidinol-phosphatase/imidazoleglycerol-phosphate dehydratase HisB [Gammaproteobacteria bacterium]
MNGRAILFIDRDGTLIEEPADEQVDRLDKIRLLPDVIPALTTLRDAGYRFVMVSNQDGLGTEAFPTETFEGPQQFLANLFAGQGISFEATLICPHLPADQCDCRKPRTGLVEKYLADGVIDPEMSFVIGDRDSDMELAQRMGIGGLKINGRLGWTDIAGRLIQPPRRAAVSRKTKETEIEVTVDLDTIPDMQENQTGIGFFDHMLDQIGRHGGFSLTLKCRGDLHVDEHHTVEDSALALGAALREALDDKQGIARYGFVLPMDESSAQVSIDLSGRPYLVFDGAFTRESVGGLPTELVPHFFRSLCEGLRAAIHINLRGENNHHMIEAAFKGLGRCLRQAIQREGTSLPSTKGML